MPLYRTARLLLRPRRMTEYEFCLAMDRDPKVTRFIPGPWNDHLQHTRFLFDRIERRLGTGLGYRSILANHDEQTFLGWIMLIPWAGIGSDIEIGWRLKRAAWGHGYATEAARAVVEHAFGVLDVDKIVADIHPGNLRSIRVAEKVGLTFSANTQYRDQTYQSYLMTRQRFDVEYRVDSKPCSA